MRARRSHLWISWIAAVLAGILFGLATSHASNEPVIGSWKGMFHCGNAGSAFTLTFEEGSGGLLEGEFRFSIPDGSGATGAYRIRGRYTPDNRSFTVVPGDWIDRPSGWRASGISGSIHENGLTMNGAVRGCAGRSGNFEFRGEREGVPVTPEGLPAVVADLLTPPTAGSMEGHWNGAIACSDFDIRIALDIVQDGDGVVAVSTVSAPTSRGAATYVDSRQIMPGTAADDSLVLSGLNRVSFRNLGLPRVIGELDLAMVDSDRIEGAVRQMQVPSNWRCQTAVLHRGGPARTPSGADRHELIGTWAGFDSDNLRDYSRTTQAEIVIADDGGHLYGTYSAARPINREPALQDRYATSVRPLLVLDDGRLAFVSVAVKREEGAFAESSPYLGAAFLLALSMKDDGGLDVERIGRANSPKRIVLQPMNDEAIAGLRLGEGPPFPLPMAIGGAIAEAATLDAQCRTIRDWTEPVFAAYDLQRMTFSTGTEAVLPLFDDSAFMATFGLPFGLTTEEERKAVWALGGSLCVQRIGLKRATVMDHAFGRSFDEVVGMLIDRQESGNWHQGVIAEIAELSDDKRGLERLRQIEAELGVRSGEISAEDQATLAAVVAGRRDRIAVADIMKRAEEIPSWPSEIATLDRLAVLWTDATDVSLPSQELADLMREVRRKVNAIIVPPIEVAIASADAAPTTLDGLADVTRIQREIQTLVARLEPALGVAAALESVQPLHYIRMSLINNEEIQKSFRARLEEIGSSQDAARSVESVARQYLDEPHFRGPTAIPAYAQAVAAATTALEMRSISFVDRSSRVTEGEPTAEELLVAVKVQFDQINEELSTSFRRCQRGEFQNDPVMAMECLGMLAAGGGSEFRMRLTRFEKLGCAGAVGQAGFICDYVLGFQSNSPFMQGRMEELMKAGSMSQGRFIKFDGGWQFTPIQ